MERTQLFLCLAGLIAIVIGYRSYNCVPIVFVAPTPQQPSTCLWTFVKYEASPFEDKFLSHADEWGQRPCNAMTALRQEAEEWVTLATKSMRGPLPRNVSNSVLSSLFYRKCDGEVVRIPIEPVGGCLRHPFTCDNPAVYIVEKDSWIVIDWHAHAHHPARNFLFDVGASTWNAGAGGASQVWMWEQYRKRGVDFDAFYAWEASKHDPSLVWGQLPEEVRPRYHWLNIPAQFAPGNIDNPLEVIRQVAKPEDFVVLKLDIDTPSVEKPLVEQLASDPGLAALVDEFFFEHHVNMEPLASCCWGTTAMNETAASSFRLFSKLRRLGIRAHSWV